MGACCSVLIMICATDWRVQAVPKVEADIMVQCGKQEAGKEKQNARWRGDFEGQEDQQIGLPPPGTDNHHAAESLHTWRMRRGCWRKRGQRWQRLMALRR